MGLNTDGFYAQRDMPETEEKQIARANLLTTTEKFLKTLLLNNIEIGKIKPKDFYNNYERYCILNKINVEKYHNFLGRLEKLGIQIVKSGTHYYEIHLKQLKDLSVKEKWMCKYDEYDKKEKDDDDENINILRSFYDELIETKQQYNENSFRNNFFQDKFFELQDKFFVLERENRLLKMDIVEMINAPIYQEEEEEEEEEEKEEDEIPCDIFITESMPAN
jgi:hypothetical protein